MLTMSLYNESGSRNNEEDREKIDEMHDEINLDINLRENNNSNFRHTDKENSMLLSNQKKNKRNNINQDYDDINSFSKRKRNNFDDLSDISPIKKAKRDNNNIENDEDNILTKKSRSDIHKFIFKIIYDNTKSDEYQTISADNLWNLVCKNKDFSSYGIKNKKQMLQIVRELDDSGKCMYSNEDDNITLV